MELDVMFTKKMAKKEKQIMNKSGPRTEPWGTTEERGQSGI